MFIVYQLTFEFLQDLNGVQGRVHCVKSQLEMCVHTLYHINKCKFKFKFSFCFHTGEIQDS